MSRQQKPDSGQTVHVRSDVVEPTSNGIPILIPTFSPLDEARKVFPTRMENELSYILWEHTGYPEFWPMRDGESNRGCLIRQLIEYRDSLEVGDRV